MDLLNRIKSAKKEYKAVDYMPLIKELNTLLTPIAAKIKAKETRSKNSHDANKNTSSLSDDTAPNVAV
ncbi:MAG: hypothetical protein PHD04_02135 [Candidatus Pacebacteria bacterium]|nr:hypothetical protein [Candidatus Paceibacterota bacterium]